MRLVTSALLSGKEMRPSMLCKLTENKQTIFWTLLAYLGLLRTCAVRWDPVQCIAIAWRPTHWSFPFMAAALEEWERPRWDEASPVYSPDGVSPDTNYVCIWLKLEVYKWRQIYPAILKDQTGTSNICTAEFNCNNILRWWLVKTPSITLPLHLSICISPSLDLL